MAATYASNCTRPRLFHNGLRKRQSEVVTTALRSIATLAVCSQEGSPSIQPSSAAAESVFLKIYSSFNDSQDHAPVEFVLLLTLT